MKRTIETLKNQIKEELCEQATKELTQDGLRLNHNLAKSWLTLDDIWCRLESYEDTESESDKPSRTLTEEEIRHWNDNMMNADGTKGGHWTVEQTDVLAGNVGVYFEHITNKEWNVACNMIYSDYVNVARSMDVSNTDFFGSMAKAFLFDRDGPGPKKKLFAYYYYIVK